MTCPACNSTLVTGYTLREKDSAPFYVVYCAAGKCTSKVANEGGVGSTEDKAFEDLCAKVEKEQTK